MYRPSHFWARIEDIGGQFLSRRHKQGVVVLLVTTFALAAGSAAQKSVTVDEYQALPHGLAILKTGDLHLATGVPLLPSVLPALPLLATDVLFDPAPMRHYVSSWECGAQFLIENGFVRDRETGQTEASGRYGDFFLLGRLVSISVLLLTCSLAYGYARKLYGRQAGFVALLLACFSPNLLAHGQLVTPDICLAAAMMASLWAFDRLAEWPTWIAAGLFGLCLGLAALTKLTGMLLFVLLPGSLVVSRLVFGRRERQSPEGAATVTAWRLAEMIGIACIVGLLVVNAGYGFGGTGMPLRAYHFESPQMQAMAAVLPGWLPVPLPRFFFAGIDAQLAESGYDAYLMGEFNQHGFYSYYLVALLVKTPVPVLLLCGLAWLFGGRVTRRELPLVFTALSLLVFFSLSRHKNIGLRYVLFLEPMMAVWLGRLLSDARPPAAWLHRTVWLLTACLPVIALAIWPHYLPYFNLASGGSNNGHRWLLDSNLDWGQDLITLRRHMEREQIDEIDLAYFGRVPPQVYGVRFRTLHPGEPPQNRYVAISANLLWGRMYYINGNVHEWPDDPDSYRAFRHLRPKAILGHSIYLFDMSESAKSSSTVAASQPLCQSCVRLGPSR